MRLQLAYVGQQPFCPPAQNPLLNLHEDRQSGNQRQNHDASKTKHPAPTQSEGHT
jgi:hypothetical protein